MKIRLKLLSGLVSPPPSFAVFSLGRAALLLEVRMRKWLLNGS